MSDTSTDWRTTETAQHHALHHARASLREQLAESQRQVLTEHFAKELGVTMLFDGKPVVSMDQRLFAKQIAEFDRELHKAIMGQSVVQLWPDAEVDIIAPTGKPRHDGIAAEAERRIAAASRFRTGDYVLFDTGRTPDDHKHWRIVEIRDVGTWPDNRTEHHCVAMHSNGDGTWSPKGPPVALHLGGARAIEPLPGPTIGVKVTEVSLALDLEQLRRGPTVVRWTADQTAPLHCHDVVIQPGEEVTFYLGKDGKPTTVKPPPAPRSGQRWRSRTTGLEGTIVDYNPSANATHPYLVRCETRAFHACERSFFEDRVDFVSGPTSPETPREELERVIRLEAESPPAGVTPMHWLAELLRLSERPSGPGSGPTGERVTADELRQLANHRRGTRFRILPQPLPVDYRGRGRSPSCDLSEEWAAADADFHRRAREAFKAKEEAERAPRRSTIQIRPGDPPPTPGFFGDIVFGRAVRDCKPGEMVCVDVNGAFAHVPGARRP